MTRATTFLLFCAFLCGSSWSAEPWTSPLVLGAGTLITEPARDEECGTLLVNHNNTCEMRYAWRYGGVVPPDYGSFAECYSGSGEVCAAVFGFSSTGTQNGQTLDVFICSRVLEPVRISTMCPLGRPVFVSGRIVPPAPTTRTSSSEPPTL